MNRDEAITRLKQQEADLKRLGVEHLYMSDQRRAATRKTSPTLAYFSATKRVGVYELMDVKAYAARILGRKTDITTRDSLHKTFRHCDVSMFSRPIATATACRARGQDCF